MIHPAIKTMEGFIQRFKRRSIFGPAQRFSDVDFLRLIWLLGRRTGRLRLAQALGIGEGSMRTMLVRLQKQGVALSAPQGWKLTEAGFTLLKQLQKRVKAARWVAPNYLSFNKPAFCLQLCSARAGSMAERDEAVKAGALGATVLSFNRGFFISGAGEAERDARYAAALKRLAKEFEMRDSDALVLCYGDNAERGAWAVAARMLQ
jgi:hypothetical protein